MESFETIVAAALGTEGLVVAGPVKFPMVVRVQKKTHVENQTHGFEAVR